MIETQLFIEQSHWETSQDKSHQYYVCASKTQAEFENLVTHIRKHGYVITIQGKSYACLDMGEYLYWTMWYSIEDTNFINRMRI